VLVLGQHSAGLRFIMGVYGRRRNGKVHNDTLGIA
jgi:hypothetical protein